MFIPGTFIKWTSQDADGEFYIVGMIITYELEQRIEFMDANGSMNSIPYDEGMWSPAKKPDDWDTHIAAVANRVLTRKPRNASAQCVAPLPPIKKRSPRSSNGMSKKELGRKIFEQHQSAGRATIIQQLMSELNMTKAGAGTYYANYNSGRW